MHRRYVAGLVSESTEVRGAEERDRVVVSDDDDVPQRVRSERVDDALDLLCDEVFRERASGIGCRLLLEDSYARIAGDVDHNPIDFRSRGKSGELVA